METSLVNMEETTKATRPHPVGNTEKMRWDTTTIDKLLYLVNSIVLLVCGVVLMFIIKPLDAPHKSIQCWPPAEFTGAWTRYNEKHCLTADGRLFGKREHLEDGVPPFSNETTEHDEIFPSRPSNSDFTSSLILMSILSLLPIICWWLVGSIDGRDFLTKGGTSTQNGFIVMFWFLITKVGAAALCALFVVLIFGMKGQGDEYLDVVKYNRKPEDLLVLCEFMIRKVKQSLHRYTVQCIVSKGEHHVSSVVEQMFSCEHILGSMLNCLQIWLITLLVVNVFNLLAMAIFVLSLSNRSARINFIRRYVPAGTEMATCGKLDHRLGFTGAIVFGLAVRQGNGKLVKNALTEFCSHEN